MDADESEGEEDEEDEEMVSVPVLTKSTLQKWQKAILEVRRAEYAENMDIC